MRDYEDYRDIPENKDYQGGSTPYGYYTFDGYEDAESEGSSFKEKVQLGLKELITRLWHEHPGKCLGSAIGLMMGVLILLFGFMTVFFVVLCGAIGLFIGINVDKGGNWLDNIRRSLPDDIHRWR